MIFAFTNQSGSKKKKTKLNKNKVRPKLLAQPTPQQNGQTATETNTNIAKILNHPITYKKNNINNIKIKNLIKKKKHKINKAIT